MNTEKCKQCKLAHKEKGILRPPCFSCQTYLDYIEEKQDLVFPITPGICKVLAVIRDEMNKSGKTNEEIKENLDTYFQENAIAHNKEELSDGNETFISNLSKKNY